MVHWLALTLNLLLLCAGQDLSAASSQTYIVQPNDNATLSCNISDWPSASQPITVSWFHYRDDELKPVMVTEFSKLFKTYMRIQNENNPPLDSNNEVDPWKLLIIGVEESDLGVYHCLLQRHNKALIVEASIRLSFTGETSGEQGSPLNWTLLACVGLAAAFLGASVTFSIARYQANHSSDNTGNKDLKGIDLHYASLKCHGINGQKKLTRPPDVTYATVASRSPVGVSGLLH
ncbi:uncharacterized protein LOC125285835 [Alosa alosa]|nr:uncharacterized protein LOC125285835 [Alosa alosa]